MIIFQTLVSMVFAYLIGTEESSSALHHYKNIQNIFTIHYILPKNNCLYFLQFHSHIQHTYSIRYNVKYKGR